MVTGIIVIELMSTIVASTVILLLKQEFLMFPLLRAKTEREREREREREGERERERGRGDAERSFVLCF